MGPGLVYLSEPIKTKISSEGESDTLKFSATSMQGWRINMEDAHIAQTKFGGDPNAALFGVFDGHGGGEVAEFVKRHFPEELLKSPDYIAGKYDKALANTFLKMDTLLEAPAGKEAILKLCKEFKAKCTSSPSKRGLEETQDEGPDMKGCTANVLLIKNKTMYIANAGDSRAILGTKEKVIELSVDHKPDNEGEKARILKAGGTVIEGRVDGNLNLSRALGDLRYKVNTKLKPQEQMITADPEIRIEPIKSNYDFIVMGCDGIYETKTSQQIVDYFYEQFKLYPSSHLKVLVERYLDSILSPDYMKTDGAGCDNMSCILIKFKHGK